MAKIRVTVLMPHPYSKGLKVGDTYEVSGQTQLALVKAMKWAKEADPEPEQPAKNTYRTRDMTASRAVQAVQAPADPPAEPPSIFTRARRVVAKKAVKDEAPKVE